MRSRRSAFVISAFLCPLVLAACWALPESRIQEAQERLVLIRGDLLYVDDATSELVRSEIGDVELLLEALRESLVDLQYEPPSRLEEFRANTRSLLDELEDHFESIDSLMGPVPKDILWDDWSRRRVVDFELRPARHAGFRTPPLKSHGEVASPHCETETGDSACKCPAFS
jgi:hypothetical protein